MDIEDKKLTVDAWKQVVQVQMHFNDLELRIRNFAVATTGAFLAFGGYTLKDAGYVAVAGFSVSVASLVVISSILPVVSFYLMERFWYHPLLVGSVNEGANLESGLSQNGIPISLGSNITRKSGVQNWILGEALKFSEDDLKREPALQRYKKELVDKQEPADGKYYLLRWGFRRRRAFRSHHKMNWFYAVLCVSLALLAAFLSLSANPPIGKTTTEALTAKAVHVSDARDAPSIPLANSNSSKPASAPGAPPSRAAAKGRVKHPTRRHPPSTPAPIAKAA